MADENEQSPQCVPNAYPVQCQGCVEHDLNGEIYGYKISAKVGTQKHGFLPFKVEFDSAFAKFFLIYIVH